MKQITLLLVQMFPLSLICWIIGFILTAVAMMQLTAGRGLTIGGLAWTPFGRQFLWGAVADDINHRRGRKTRRRIQLVVTISGQWLLFLAGYCIAVPISLSDPAFVYETAGLEPQNTTYIILTVAVVLWGISLICLLLHKIFYLMTIYRIIDDYLPRSSTALIILSAFLPFLPCFVLLSCKHLPAWSIDPVRAANPFLAAVSRPPYAGGGPFYFPQQVQGGCQQGPQPPCTNAGPQGSEANSIPPEQHPQPFYNEQRPPMSQAVSPQPQQDAPLNQFNTSTADCLRDKRQDSPQ